MIASRNIALAAALTVSGVACVHNDWRETLAADGLEEPKLTVDGVGHGHIVVVEEPGGCGLDCMGQSGKGVVLRLTAIPDEGSRFEGWAGACEGMGSCRFLADEFPAYFISAAFSDQRSDWSRLLASEVSLSDWSLAVSPKGESLVADRGDSFLSRFAVDGTRVFRLEAPRGFEAHAVAFDPGGSAIVAGQLDAKSTNPASPNSAFLFKVDPKGRELWRRVVRASGEAIIDAVAVDDSGSIYAAGRIAGKLDGTPFDAPDRSGGMLLRFDPEGSLDPAFTQPGPVAFSAVALSGDNVLAVAGSSIVSFSSSGRRQFVSTPAGVAARFSTIAATGDGDVVVGGTVTGDAITIGDESLPRIGSREWSDALLVRLSPKGEIVWARRFGGRGDDTIARLAPDGHGGVFVGGTFTGPMEFGSRSLTSRDYWPDEDIDSEHSGSVPHRSGFYGHIDRNGALEWAEAFGGLHASPDGIAVVGDRLYLLLDTLVTRNHHADGGLSIYGEFDHSLVKRSTNGL